MAKTTTKKTPGRRSATKTADFRRRQVSVAAILDETFGELAKCDPDLWERRAYLMLIGLVYEKLATCEEEELATDELIALAKALAENRRANAKPTSARPADAKTGSADGRKLDDTDDNHAPPTGELPQRFAHAVRQVYGIGD